jgi:hypothetical protein
MKKFLLAATVLSAAGLFSPVAFGADLAPVAEESQFGLTADIWGGYYFLGGSNGDADDDDNQEDFPAMGADASVIFGVSDEFLLQGTAQGALNFLGSADDDQMESGWQIAAHAMHGSGFGVFGGYGGAEYDDNDEDTTDLWFLGAEYLYDFDSGDILLQAGYLDSNLDDNATLADAWFVRAAPSFNVSESVAMGLHAGYADGEMDSVGENGYVVSWGASLDYALDSMPLTLFVAYDGLYVDGEDASADEHQVKAGIQISLGGLADREIDTPEIFRWVAVGQRTD